MVHLSDLDWKRPGEQVIEEYKKGDKVKAQVLDVDVEKERISLGVKQLEADPFAEPGDLKRGAVVTTEVTEVKEGGIDVKIVGTEFTAFIKRNELARDRSEQRPERFAVGQKVDARVTQFDKKARKVGVSIKALEVAEEKEAIAQYGSSDSGATLGDILGTALKQREKKDVSRLSGRLSPRAGEGADRRLRGRHRAASAALRWHRISISFATIAAPSCAPLTMTRLGRHLSARIARGRNRHVARCRPDRRSPPHAAQAHVLARCSRCWSRSWRWSRVAATVRGAATCSRRAATTSRG